MPTGLGASYIIDNYLNNPVSSSQFYIWRKKAMNF